MAPLQYCAKRLDTHPWKRWIKLSIVDEQDGIAVLALLALMQEFVSVTQLEHNEVALAKLQWWQQQIELYYQQQATHPVLLALQQATPPPLPQQAFDNMLEGFWYQLNTQDFDLHHLTLYLKKTYGSLFSLMGAVLDKQQTISSDALKQLGQFVGLSLMLQDLGDDIRTEQLLLFPTDLLAEHELTAQDLSTPKENSDTPNKVLTALIQHTKASKPVVDNVPFFALLNQYYAALIQQIEPDGVAILQQRTVLSPLYFMWILIKATYQSKKRKK